MHITSERYWRKTKTRCSLGDLEPRQSKYDLLRESERKPIKNSTLFRLPSFLTFSQAQSSVCIIMSVLLSGCELDGTVYNVSYSGPDGCQTCTCRVSICILLHLETYRLSPTNLTYLHLLNRGVNKNALPSRVLHWTAHSGRL